MNALSVGVWRAVYLKRNIDKLRPFVMEQVWMQCVGGEPVFMLLLPPVPYRHDP